MNQLYLYKIFIPMHRCDLTYEELQMVLESHMFLKQKQYVRINAWKVAGDNKQPTYINKEYASSPSIITESVILLSIVNA